MKKMWLAGFLVGVLVLMVSCANSPSEGRQEAKMTEMTLEDWEAVSGTPVALVDPNPDSENRGGDYPYFCARVVETAQDYIVVEPLTRAREDPQNERPWGESLLQKSKTYIVPRALMGHFVLEQEDAPMGSVVEIGFSHAMVVENTAYGQSPVMRIVYYVYPVEDGDSGC